MYKYPYCLYQGIVKSINDDGVEHAGYMAFLVILSLFPFLVFFLSLTSFFGASEIGRGLIEIMLDSGPDSIVGSIKTRLEELRYAPPSSLLNLAIIGTIWTASSFVEGLRTILNRIFRVSSPPPYITRRLLSIFQFLILCVILAAIMLIFIIIPIILKYFNINSIHYPVFIQGYTKQLYIFICLFFCVLGFYIFIPNAKMTIIDMVPGAFTTTIAWQISGHLLSKYIGYYHQLSLVYGSLGSIIVTMLFFYIINFIFIVGAAFNYELTIYEKK
jgi:membrane protein